MHNYTKPNHSVQTGNSKPVTNPYAISVSAADVSQYLGINRINSLALYCQCRDLLCQELLPSEVCLEKRS